MSKRKRHSISLQTKYEILQPIEQKMAYNEILLKYKNELNDVYNISKIKSKKIQIMAEYESNKSSETKSLKKSKLDQNLLNFIAECNSLGVPIDTHILREKAIQISKQLNITDFKASNGYIDRFKQRNMVLFQKIQGEATSVPESQCNDWKLNKLPLIIKDYEEKDIFNGDEFGLL
jgi:flagella basal body P-ring formation protein FlgA